MVNFVLNILFLTGKSPCFFWNHSFHQLSASWVVFPGLCFFLVGSGLLCFCTCTHRLQDTCYLPLRGLQWIYNGYSLPSWRRPQAVYLSPKIARLEPNGPVYVRTEKLVVSILHFGFIKTNTENSTAQVTNTQHGIIKHPSNHTLRQAAVLFSQPHTTLHTSVSHSLINRGCLHIATSFLTSLGPVKLLRPKPVITGVC